MQLLSCIRPFASSVHAAMVSPLPQQKDNQGATGGPEENNRRTRSGDAGSRGQAGVKKGTTGGQEEKDKTRTQGWPARPEDNSRTTASTRRTRGGQDPDPAFMGRDPTGHLAWACRPLSPTDGARHDGLPRCEPRCPGEVPDLLLNLLQSCALSR